MPTTSWGNSGNIQVVSPTAHSSTSTPGRMEFFTTNTGATSSSSPAMVISEDGKVGIGTSAPANSVSIEGAPSATYTPMLSISNTAATGTNNYTQMEFKGTGRTFWMGVGNSSETAYNLANKFFVWDYTSAVARLVVDTSGNVGIGTATPGAALEVAGQVKITGGNPGNGKVLTSDGSGLATWQTPAAGNSGTVTSITAGTGLTGGTITTGGTIGLGTELTGLAGLSANGFVKRTGAGTYTSSSTLSLTADISGVLPIANGGTNSSTTLNNNRLMASVSGSIQEMGAMTNGQIVVGKTSDAPQIVSLSGDATINNTGAITLGTGVVTSTKILDGTVGVADLNFAGTMTTNTGLVVRDGTQFHNKTCSGNQALIWSVANGWICSAITLTESDPKVGANTTNYMSKWDGSALVASGIFENASGNVGIGTSSPGYKLQVQTMPTSTAAVDSASAFNYTYAYPTELSASRFIGQINGTENGNTAAITGAIIGQVNYANNMASPALNKLSGSWNGVKKK